jgi:serine/threonine protein kinase
LYDVDAIVKELEELTEDEDEMENMPKWQQEVWAVKRKIKVAFKRDFAPPVTVIDFYHIGRVLGKGAYGKVLLGLHRLSRKLCAVKSISKAKISDLINLQKLKNEIFIHRQLRHPNVCKLLETIDIDTHNLIFIELCRGGDLLHYIRRRRRLPEATAKLIFK